MIATRPKVEDGELARRLVRVEAERDAWLERCCDLEQQLRAARERIAELEAKAGAS